MVPLEKWRFSGPEAVVFDTSSAAMDDTSIMTMEAASPSTLEYISKVHYRCDLGVIFEGALELP